MIYLLVILPDVPGAAVEKQFQKVINVPPGGRESCGLRLLSREHDPDP